MSSIFDRELLVVSGKGGVGKSTIAAALSLLAAERGLRTIVAEVGEQSRLRALFGVGESEPGEETELQKGLWSISIDPDRALMEWLQSLGGRVSGRVLASSSTFQYFAAAAPGAKELVSMVKIWELTQGKRWRGRGRGYDLVVLDAPATGHALGMLDSPRTFGAIARVGPIAGQAERLAQLLQDPGRSDYIAVAHASELAVTETLELQRRLGEQLGRELRAVIVNGTLPQRFDGGELKQLSSLTARAERARQPRRATAQPKPSGEVQPRASRLSASTAGDRAATVQAAAAAARAVSERARAQHNQLARLRRRGFDVVSVPFQFSDEVALAGVRQIAEQLRRKF
jgi:energy-coupling factor transporter ATP-binding protein EcfA2